MIAYFNTIVEWIDGNKALAASATINGILGISVIGFIRSVFSLIRNRDSLVRNKVALLRDIDYQKDEINKYKSELTNINEELKNLKSITPDNIDNAHSLYHELKLIDGYSDDVKKASTSGSTRTPNYEGAPYVSLFLRKCTSLIARQYLVHQKEYTCSRYHVALESQEMYLFNLFDKNIMTLYIDPNEHVVLDEILGDFDEIESLLKFSDLYENREVSDVLLSSLILIAFMADNLLDNTTSKKLRDSVIINLKNRGAVVRDRKSSTFIDNKNFPNCAAAFALAEVKFGKTVEESGLSKEVIEYLDERKDVAGPMRRALRTIKH